MASLPETVVTGPVSGVRRHPEIIVQGATAFARALKNTFTDNYGRTGAPVLPFPWHYVNATDIYREAAAQGNAEYFPMWGGQSIGLIHNLSSAAEVIETTIHEARVLLMERLPQVVRLSA